MRIPGCVLALLLLAGSSAAQEPEPEPDRHAARREWLARRRAGELPDSLPAPARAPTVTRPERSRGGEAGGERGAEAARPHRFAERYRPNHEAPSWLAEPWPLQPYGGLQPWGPFGYGQPFGYGSPFGGYGYGPSWYPSAPWGGTHSCARVTIGVVPGGRYTLYLFLPPASPYDGEELELLLERELAAGRPLQLQSAEGAWVGVRPGARIEAVRVSACGR